MGAFTVGDMVRKKAHKLSKNDLSCGCEKIEAVHPSENMYLINNSYFLEKDLERCSCKNLVILRRTNKKTNSMEGIKNKLIEASQVYGDQIVIRSLVNLIPSIGGALDLLLSSTGQNFIIRRIESLLRNLELELSQLHEEAINKDFLNSEQGFDLVVKAFNSASRTRQEEKLAFYARILKNSLDNSKEFEEDEPEIFLSIVESLSVQELRVLKCIFESKDHKDQNPTNSSTSFGTSAHTLAELYPEFDKDELVSILIRLERTGLIKEVIAMHFGYSGGAYEINPLFVRLMDFLKTH